MHFRIRKFNLNLVKCRPSTRLDVDSFDAPALIMAMMAAGLGTGTDASSSSTAPFPLMQLPKEILERVLECLVDHDPSRIKRFQRICSINRARTKKICALMGAEPEDLRTGDNLVEEGDLDAAVAAAARRPKDCAVRSESNLTEYSCPLCEEDNCTGCDFDDEDCTGQIGSLRTFFRLRQVNKVLRFLVDGMEERTWYFHEYRLRYLMQDASKQSTVLHRCMMLHTDQSSLGE